MQSKLSRLRDWGFLLAPGIALITALFKHLPPLLSFIICLYLGLVWVRLSLCWRYYAWNASKDERAESLRRLMVLAHRTWLILILVIPVMTVCVDLAGSSLPTLADSLVAHSLQERASLDGLNSKLMKIGENSTLENGRLYAHVKKGGDSYLVQADELIALAVDPLLPIPGEIAMTVWILLLLALGAFKFTELLGETSCHLASGDGTKPPVAA
jgi:hypothetical protein